MSMEQRGGRQRRGTRSAREPAWGHHACVFLVSKRYRYPCVLRNARALHSRPVGFCRRTCRVLPVRLATETEPGIPIPREPF